MIVLGSIFLAFFTLVAPPVFNLALRSRLGEDDGGLASSDSEPGRARSIPDTPSHKPVES